MRADQRTENLAYEIQGEVDAPLTPPPLCDSDEYRAQFERDSPFPPRISRWLYSVAGMESFLRHLREDPVDYEHMLRTQDVRLSATSLLALNATLALEDDDGHRDMCQRAAALVVAAGQFFDASSGGRLEVDRHRGMPLEMGQYGNLFSTCLYPRGTCSRVFKPRYSGFIVVIAGGAIFRLELGPRHARRTAEDLRQDLVLIARAAPRGPRARELAATSIGSAGFLARSAGMSVLRLRRENRRTLDTISRALFVLCLDLDSRPSTERMLARSIHATESWNRWQLSSLQIVVTANARAGIVMSFPCGLDGNVMARFASQVQRSAKAMQWVASLGEVRSPSAPVPLELRVPAGVLEKVNESVRSVLREDQDHFLIPDIGDHFFRSRGLSSDCVFTLALLISLRHLTASNAGIMEHVSLAQFRCMGVSMAAVSTRAALDFVEFVASRDFEVGRAFDLLQRASDAHRSAVRDARGSMPLKWLALHFLRRSQGPSVIPAFFVALASGATRYDCIISQPQTAPEIVACGRPGIRMPVVNIVGAHYQIHDERTEVIYMPSVKIPLSAKEIHAGVMNGMKMIAEIAQSRDT